MASITRWEEQQSLICKGVWMQTGMIHSVWEWSKEGHSDYSIAYAKALKKLK